MPLVVVPAKAGTFMPLVVVPPDAEHLAGTLQFNLIPEATLVRRPRILFRAVIARFPLARE